MIILEIDVYFKDLGKCGLLWVKEEGENICLVVNEKLRKYVNESDNKIILCDLVEKFF